MRPCTCRICTSEPGDLAAPANRSLIEGVQEHGWFMYHISGEWLSWVYSMGFEHSFDQPEVIMSGFSQPDMALALQAVAGHFAAGGEYAEDRPIAQVGDDELGLHAVHPDWLATELFHGAEWFNRGVRRASQVVLLSADPPWPRPPRLWLPPSEQSIEWRAFAAPGSVEWPHPVPWKTPVYVSKSIMRSGEWIYSVIHDSDDDWHCMDGFEFTVDDLEIAPLAAILDRDPGVSRLLDLAPGEMAWREGPAAEWQREKYAPPEE